MAKFLPFVVEKSTPLYIYQALISRSKGMNNILVTSIFYLVVDVGIIKVRKTANDLPDLPLEKLYENILIAYPAYRISTLFFKKMQSIGLFISHHCSNELSEELKEFELTDIMSFLLIMQLTDKISDYTTLNFKGLFTKKAEEAEVALKKYKLFSNDADERVFSTKEELTAYINFYTVVFPKYNKSPVKAVYFPLVIDYGKDKAKKGDSNATP